MGKNSSPLFRSPVLLLGEANRISQKEQKLVAAFLRFSDFGAKCHGASGTAADPRMPTAHRRNRSLPQRQQRLIVKDFDTAIVPWRGAYKNRNATHYPSL
jgi:hypothetical protein